MSIMPINDYEGQKIWRVETDAYDENRWYDAIKSIYDRTIDKLAYNQLRSSLRGLNYRLKSLNPDRLAESD